MDPATGIYSCDDHLDLSAVPPERLAVTPAARARRARRRTWSTRDGKPVWVCEDRVIGRSGNAGASAAREAARARSGAPASTTTATAPAHRSCGSRTWTATACAASVIYGPLVARLPDRRSRAAERVLTRRGTTGRSRSSTRSRPIGCACSRSCPATPPRPRRPSSSAARRSVTAARSSACSTSTSATRPGIGCGPRREAHRSADQLPHQGRHVVEAQLPDRQVAVGRVRDAAAAAARRAARHDGVLRRARTAPRPDARARGVGHRLAAVLPRAHGRRVARARRQARLRAEHRRRASCSAARCIAHLRGGRARPRSSSRTSAPTRACGRPTTRTPTARSPTRGTRSRSRSARCPPPTAARSPRPTARGCTASLHEPDAGQRGPWLRPRLAADAGHRRDGGVLPRARVRRGRAPARRLGLRREPDDQLPPPGDVAARRTSRCGRRPRSRRAAISASCGTARRSRWHARSTHAGAAIIEGPVARDGGRRADGVERVRRAIPTATCSSS